MGATLDDAARPRALVGVRFAGSDARPWVFVPMPGAADRWAAEVLACGARAAGMDAVLTFRRGLSLPHILERVYSSPEVAADLVRFGERLLADDVIDHAIEQSFANLTRPNSTLAEVANVS